MARFVSRSWTLIVPGPPTALVGRRVSFRTRCRGRFDAVAPRCLSRASLICTVPKADTWSSSFSFFSFVVAGLKVLVAA